MDCNASFHQIILFWTSSNPAWAMIGPIARKREAVGCITVDSGSSYLAPAKVRHLGYHQGCPPSYHRVLTLHTPEPRHVGYVVWITCACWENVDNPCMFAREACGGNGLRHNWCRFMEVHMCRLWR